MVSKSVIADLFYKLHYDIVVTVFSTKVITSKQRGGDWAGPQPPRCTIINVTAHQSTASVLITVLLYNGPLFCGFNVVVKGLSKFL